MTVPFLSRTPISSRRRLLWTCLRQKQKLQPPKLYTLLQQTHILIQQQQQQQQHPITTRSFRSCSSIAFQKKYSHNTSSRFDDGNNYNNNNSNIDATTAVNTTYGNALVIGSSGIFGQCIQQYLQEQLHMNVLGADITTTSSMPSPLLQHQETEEDKERRHYQRHQHHYPNTITEFCQLPTDTTDLTIMTHTLLKSVHSFVTATNHHPYLDVIIVAAGGFEMNPSIIKPRKYNPTSSHSNDIDPTILQNSKSYIQTMERMYNQNFNPVVAASIVAQHYMNPHLHTNMISRTNDNDTDTAQHKMKGTLMVVMGAMAALQPTPTMMGYGSAKQAIHYYIESLGASTGGGISVAASDIYTNLKSKHHHTSDEEDMIHPNSNNNSGSGSRPLVDSKLVRQAGRSVRKDIPNYDYLTVVGLLPTMLDTPRNRQSILQERHEERVFKKNVTTKIVNGTSSVQKNHDEDKGDDDNQFDFSTTLISPHDIANEIGTWITTPALRPHSGALIKVLPCTNHKAASMNSNGARFELVR